MRQLHDMCQEVATVRMSQVDTTTDIGMPADSYDHLCTVKRRMVPGNSRLRVIEVRYRSLCRIYGNQPSRGGSTALRSLRVRRDLRSTAAWQRCLIHRRVSRRGSLWWRANDDCGTKPHRFSSPKWCSQRANPSFGIRPHNLLSQAKARGRRKSGHGGRTHRRIGRD